MDKQHILDIAKPIWAEELRQRQRIFGRAVRHISEEAASRGIGRSGAHIALVFEACVEEIRVRARLARRELCKVVSQTRSRFTENQLREMYGELIVWMYKDTDLAYENVLRVMPVPQNQHILHMRALGDEQVRAIEQQYAELKLFAAIPADEEMPRVTAGQAFLGNIYGAVQTGANSTASVTQSFKAQHSGELQRAIEELIAELRMNGNSSPRGEIAIRMAEETVTELRQPSPAPKVVAKMMGGLAAMVDTLAEAPHAWDTIRHVSAMMGIPLP